jgi:hypothetical protein
MVALLTPALAAMSSALMAFSASASSSSAVARSRACQARSLRGRPRFPSGPLSGPFTACRREGIKYSETGRIV